MAKNKKNRMLVPGVHCVIGCRDILVFLFKFDETNVIFC